MTGEYLNVFSTAVTVAARWHFAQRKREWWVATSDYQNNVRAPRGFFFRRLVRILPHVGSTLPRYLDKNWLLPHQQLPLLL